MAQVKFYRGKKENYSEISHIDGVYFAVDTEEVVMNGKEYGKDPDWNEIETTSPLTTWYWEDGTTYSEEVVGILDDEKAHTPYEDCSDSATIIKVEIGNSVTSIGENAFYVCTGLTSIVIPNSVTSIGDDVFNNCSGLTSITYQGTTYTSKSALTSALTNNGVTVGDNIFDSTNLTD